jgi:parvulin-like peptidyl-prolyl isomerase
MSAMRLGTSIVQFGATLFIAWASPACNMTERSSGRSVSDAWEQPDTPSDQQGSDWQADEPIASDDSTGEGPLPVATVNGRPINRKQMLDLLVRTHGLNVLEQLIALELVRQAAERAGVGITPAGIRAEYDRALSAISSPVPAATQPVLGKEVRETLLSQILARRGVSREEFNLAMERQAYLRKIAAKQLKIDDKMLRAHYEVMYDERVQVRHIQLADWRDVARAQKLLAAGKAFADVARLHSQNPRTAPEGGLLPPFSRQGDDIPPLLRETAFRLEVGQVSNPIRINSEYHLVKPIKRFPRSKVKFEHVKEVVRLKLIERLLPEVMARIERDLFDKAKRRIVITVPVLRKQFQDRHQLGSAGPASSGR